MNRRVAISLIAVALAVAGAVPALGETPGVLTTDPRASAVSVGNTYVGWKLHVAEPGRFTVTHAGASGAPMWVSTIRVDAPRGSGHGSGDAFAVVGAGGVTATVPGPGAGIGGPGLEPGDYYVIATAAGSPASVARWVLDGPKTASVTGTLRGPAYAFTDADFGRATVVAAPGVDRRSVHGSVTISADRRLFARWVTCPGATKSVTGPPSASSWPWAGPAGVWWGQPGAWTFRLDMDSGSLQAGSTSPPCTNSLVAFDLEVPASAIPQP